MRRHPEIVRRVIARTLREEAEFTVTDAKEIVPVDTGNLRASGHVQGPERRNFRIWVTMGFGGPAGSGNQGEANTRPVGYAVYVHENCNLNFRVPGTQCKYLEDPVRRREPTLPRTIAREVAAELRRRARR